MGKWVCNSTIIDLDAIWSGQRHAPTALPPVEGDLCTHWIGGWVGLNSVEYSLNMCTPVWFITFHCCWNEGEKTVNNPVTKIPNFVALARERTIPTERPPLLGEVSANFCG
jgi:hypothetical protein